MTHAGLRAYLIPTIVSCAARSQVIDLLLDRGRKLRDRSVSGGATVSAATLQALSDRSSRLLGRTELPEAGNCAPSPPPAAGSRKLAPLPESEAEHAPAVSGSGAAPWVFGSASAAVGEDGSAAGAAAAGRSSANTSSVEARPPGSASCSTPYATELPSRAADTDVRAHKAAAAGAAASHFAAASRSSIGLANAEAMKGGRRSTSDSKGPLGPELDSADVATLATFHEEVRKAWEGNHQPSL